MKKIVFMGTPDFSVPILTMLVTEGYKVEAVVTQPDRPVGRKKVLTPTPVKEEALRLGLPVLQPVRLRGSEELQEIIGMQPDLIVTAAYGQILPKELLDAPRLGCVNVHASLLPKYRGGAPIHQAIIDGEKETGVTIMYMEEKLDAGDIISQRAVQIGDQDDTGTMFAKLSDIGTDLLRETLPSLFNETNNRTSQDESLVTFAHNISREAERIDWTKDGKAIYNQIRGLHPWPVAYTTFRGETVKVWKAELATADREGDPGEVLELDKNKLLVQTGDKISISIKEIQPAGKKKMPIDTFLNGIGSKWQIGEKFE